MYTPVSLKRTSQAMNKIATATTTVAKKHTKAPERLMKGTYNQEIYRDIFITWRYFLQFIVIIFDKGALVAESGSVMYVQCRMEYPCKEVEAGNYLLVCKTVAD